MKQRKDGRWQRIFTLNGKRICFYSSETTEKKAIKDIEKQLLNYKEKEEKGKTFEEVADEWEAEHFKTIEYSTAYRYEIYKKNAIDFFKNQYIKNISALDIEMMLSDMSHKGYASKTIKDQLSVIKMIFRYAMIHKYLNIDNSLYIKPIKGNNPVVRESLTNEQIKIVQNSINFTFGLLAYFLLYTGLRKGEALALQWKDIDFKNKVIHVNKSVYYKSNKPYIKEPKTKAGNRDVILLDCVSQKLKRGKKDEYVFNIDNKIINKSAFTRNWERYKKETGLNITAHQMRHTFATILFEAGIAAKDTQTLMGHSDISVTQNIYTHIRKSRMEGLYDNINKYVMSGCSQ